MDVNNDFIKTNLFSYPIFKIRIDPKSYDKEKILNDIMYNKKLKNKRNDTELNFDNCDIHHSYNDFDNVNFRSINYEKELEAVYLEIFNKFFNKEIYMAKTFKWKFLIANYSAVTEGQWLPTHNHHGPTPAESYDFSTVHYLNFKDDHHPTIFTNPASFSSFLRFVQPKLINKVDNTAPDNSYLYDRFALLVKEDDMIIFPAVLYHQIVLQGPTKEPRVTISTNVKIT